jgi:TolB-like protein
MDVPVAPDQVRLQLDRVLASDTFTSAARLSRFLRHVVERTLAGEGDGLKEYTIGVEVFDRDGDYDPRIDSIVRVEAARLRTKLAEYYGGPGAADPVIIQMRKGGYAPDFAQRAAGPASGASQSAAPPDRATNRARPVAMLLAAAVSVFAVTAVWRGGVGGRDQAASPLSVVVLPFAHYSASAADERLAARLTDGVTSELARTGAVSVVSHTSALRYTRPHGPLREIARALEADLVMEATVLTEGDRVRIQARLVDGVRDRKLWVEEFVGRVADPDELQRRIAGAVAEASNRPRRR